MIDARLAGLVCCSLVASTICAETPVARQIAELSADALPAALQGAFEDQTWRNLRARGDEVNRRDVANWRSIKSREDWERLRDEHLTRLRAALGGFPDPPDPAQLKIRITKAVEGDGYLLQNLVYQSRPDFWVTANLYSPSRADREAGRKLPGILIAHSHHRPKTQGELQDMGMTWARQGCLVLVIDQVGHGERADHPFQSEKDYKPDPDYRPSRQDYYHRYDTNAQLHLVGQSLMGWMAWDLMRGVDVLLARPGIDAEKIILLGAVAGGGDPAAVTAALDSRIAAAVPFNFGGPQPETRFPLPDDADLQFNYLGGAYWEGTRNLRRTGVDGFFHWLIVGSIAPRRLVYAHEFAWDQQRDPVWKRLNALYAYYGAEDRIDYTLGRGSVKGRPPEATHCTNIGRHHRQRIHAAFERWFDIRVAPDDEYSQRLDDEDLRSMTDDARRDLEPKKLYELLADRGDALVKAARERLDARPPAERRPLLQADWRRLLGDIQPRDTIEVLANSREPLASDSIVVERIALQTEPGIIVPLLLLRPKSGSKAARVVVAVSQSGKEAFLRRRSQEIADLLDGGAVVCLPDVRGAGASRGDRGELGSASYYALFFETPLLGYRLRDLRAVLKYLRQREDLASPSFALWGDSFTPPNPPATDFKVPKRVGGRPKFSEPLGGLLALLGALYEDDVRSVYVHGGLRSYRDALTSPFVYIPHDVIVPGALTAGDLADLAGALAPCRLRMEGTVDGWNRKLPLASSDEERSSPAKWLLKTNQ